MVWRGLGGVWEELGSSTVSSAAASILHTMSDGRDLGGLGGRQGQGVGGNTLHGFCGGAKAGKICAFGAESVHGVKGNR